MSPSPIDIEVFWEAVRLWRRRFFMWWIAWPFVGAAVAFGYRALVGTEPPFLLLLAALVGWYWGWMRIYGQLKRLACPSCRQPAIRNPYFFMRHARCQHCGLSYRAS